MSGSRLDQIVKGAAPPGTSIPSVSSHPSSPTSPSENARPASPPPTVGSHPSDPMGSVPSSPPQIYLNLLILEASLRSQYITLRARRRQNTFFIFLLTAWITLFFYLLFLQPREDGSGIGGSVYWVVETAEKVALMGGVVTGVLIWGTGQWERGVRWPRRFVGITNRGLRTMNCKVVVIKGPWWRELLGHFSFLFPYSSFYPSQGSAYHYNDASWEKRGNSIAKHATDEEIDLIREEDLAPGGDYIKLLLLPKPFSPDFRENWELYRTEYWEKENERRTLVLQRLKQRERKRAKEQGGWLWWTGLYGRGKPGTIVRDSDIEKVHTRQPLEKDTKRLASRRGESHSRNTSRSSTPGSLDGEERPPSRGSRRGSFGSFNDGRRKTRGVSTVGSSKAGPNRRASLSPLTRGGGILGSSSGNESG